MDIKGVVSLDFMLASMMIIVFIPCILAIAEERLNTAESAEQIILAKTLTEGVAETIDSVYSGGDGCCAIYYMPPKIRDSNYILKVNNTEVTVFINGKMGSSHLNGIGISDGCGGYVHEYMLESGGCYNISNVKINNRNVLIFKKIKK